MRMKGTGVLDVDAERSYWKQRDGLPGYPHSSDWDLITGIAVSVLLSNPDGDMAEWIQAVRARLLARDAMIPDAQVTVVTTAVFERLSLQTS